MTSFSVVTGKTISGIVHGDLAGCAAVTRQAYLAYHRGVSLNPPSYFLRFPERPEARIIALPASLGPEQGVAGIKWISSFPSNLSRGIPRASAVLVLNDLSTGYPRAVLEASIISAARTAASAVLAAGALRGRRIAGTFGIVGTGLISRYVLTFLRGLGWELGRVVLFDRNRADAERFQAHAQQQPGSPPVDIADDVEALIRASDLIAFATTAPQPHVHDPALFAHCPLVLHLSLRDLAPAIVRQAYNVVDDAGHVLTAQTSLHLASVQTEPRELIAGTIAQALLGELAIGADKPIVVSPFGLGVLDLALGQWVFELAVAREEVLHVADFFHELSR